MTDDKQSSPKKDSDSDESKKDESRFEESQKLQKEELKQDGPEVEPDWTLHNLNNHPLGMESAIAENHARMESETLAIIANGTIDEIEAALQKNLEQLAALQRHIEKLTSGG
ncbi:MAG: hypothetical protein KC777_26390 [Cyanobacteria bacterium HKST-UBA02]|nr:hypothetical protein [Cyanobacteria bacterium HKST-UBA02]